jgi:hypothetical protein
MFKLGSHDPFGHLKHKLWPKEMSGIKLTIWFPTTKSQKSTQFPFMKVACDISLESYQWGLQFCFRFHCNWRSEHKFIRPQNCESPNYGNFGTPIWKSQDKMPFGCGPHGDCRVYYKGEGGGFPQVRVVMNILNSSLLVVRPSTKSAQTMH